MIWSKKLISTQYTKVLSRTLLTCVTVIMFFGFQTSCQKERKPSILIITFDQLNTENLSCADDKPDDNSGFALLCKESLRFTHAYTTSLQPAAALGSILTGQYPLAHELHRSFDRVNPNVTTIQQLAIKAGYRTGFFGGSPHVLKKTGLANYFETFDDSSAANLANEIIKDFQKTTEAFLDWQNEEPDRPFFALITNSENEALNDRDTNVTSFDKIDEKLYNFIIELKKQNIWNSTYVYFASLRGSNNYNRIDETTFSNLHSENTMISLLIKPPRMQGDEGISWKNDTLVNLADVGYTLKSFFKLDDPSILKELPLINIDSDINEISNSNRNLMIESPNTWVESPLEINLVLLNKNYLAIEKNKNIEVYNLMTDRFEVVNIANKNETNVRAILEQYKKLREIKPSLAQNNPPKNAAINARDFLKLATSRNTFFEKYIPESSNPLFLYYINKKIRTKEMLNTDLSRLDKPFQQCLKILHKQQIKQDDLKYCQDELLHSYIKYKKSHQLNLSNEKMRFHYDQERKKFYAELKIATWNLALENIWGIYNQNKTWYHPLIYLDPQFYNSL